MTNENPLTHLRRQFAVMERSSTGEAIACIAPPLETEGMTYRIGRMAPPHAGCGVRETQLPVDSDGPQTFDA